MPESLDDEWRRINAFGNPAGPRDWSPSVDPLASSRGGGPGRPGNGRRGLWLGTTVAIVIAALVGGAVWFGGQHSRAGASDGPLILAATDPAGSPVAIAPTTAVQLTADTAVGTCLAAGAPAKEAFVACTKPHRYELVSHARASGDAYPSDDYWNGPVAEQCYQDALKYVGIPRDQWPSGLDTTSFIPVTQGWAAGDRAVYCLAEWSADATTSVKGLKPGTTRPSTVPTGPTVLAGPLTRVADPNGSPGCLGIMTGPNPVYVVESATNAFSWTVTVDGDGNTDDSVSGIVSGGDPAGRDFLAHTGDAVHLTGRWTTYAAPGVCGSTRVFDFTTID